MSRFYFQSLVDDFNKLSIFFFSSGFLLFLFGAKYKFSCINFSPRQPPERKTPPGYWVSTLVVVVIVVVLIDTQDRSTDRSFQ